MELFKKNVYEEEQSTEEDDNQEVDNQVDNNWNNDLDITGSEIENIPRINYSLNWDYINRAKINIIHLKWWNLLLKWGKISEIKEVIYGAPVDLIIDSEKNDEENLNKWLQSWSFRLDDGLDKIIDIWNFEIEEAIITRRHKFLSRKKDKITIDIQGKIHDNDWHNSINVEDPINRHFVWTLENVKWWYEWTIPYRPLNDPNFIKATEKYTDEERFEASTAKIFFREADLLIWPEHYNNEDFLIWITSFVRRKVREKLNRFRKDKKPLLKKIAKLTVDHKLITKFEKSKKEWKLIFSTLVFWILIWANQEQIIDKVKGISDISKLPSLNLISESNTGINLQNATNHTWIIEVKYSETFWILISNYLVNNNIKGWFNNIWRDLKNFPETSKIKKWDIFEFEIVKNKDWTWNIIQVKKKWMILNF